LITGIGHVAIAVRNLDKSLEFYCSGLGLTEAFRLTDEETGRVRCVYVRIGPGQFLELFPPAPDAAVSTEPLPRGHYRHTCLVVDDIHATVEELKRRGVEPVSALKRGLRDGNWQVFVEDPDGNRLELMQIEPTSPQALAG
jgi:catechol 2,3-dioxygenase-like lactoylglutathione lyase family enzyme